MKPQLARRADGNKEQQDTVSLELNYALLQKDLCIVQLVCFCLADIVQCKG